MIMRDEDLYVSALDLRQGMGIGGWNMEWTYQHLPTGCEVRYTTNGSSPGSQIAMRERALMALELLVEIYPAP